MKEGKVKRKKRKKIRVGSKELQGEYFNRTSKGRKATTVFK